MTSDHELLLEGVRLFDAGQRQLAGRRFVELLRLDPLNEQAWWWLSGCVDSEVQKIDCLRRVLNLNPDHVEAREALAALDPSAVEKITPVTAPLKAESLQRQRPLPRPLARTAPLRAFNIHQAQGAGELLEAAWAAEADEDFPAAYDLYTRVLEIDNTTPEAWLGKGFSAGMLSTPNQNRVREFLHCLNRAVLAREPEGVTVQQAALRLDSALAQACSDYILRLYDFTPLRAGRSAPAMANIYAVERVQLADWACYIGQPFSQRGGRAFARADLIYTANDAFERIAVNLVQTTRGPRARRELLETFRDLILKNLQLSGLTNDPELVDDLNEIVKRHA